jgi:3',5'-cyclic-nucleotide phosphodiesterase
LAPISPTHLSSLAEKVNDWDFHAGRLEEEELIWCAVLILEHVITTGTQDLIRFKISQGTHHQIQADTDEILFFLLTVRSCYQPTNHYHNFRHAIDVLQATFQILVMSNIIPPLVTSNPPSPKVVPPLLPLSYLRPVEVLALCIAAIGHDAAHPGVTNAFLASSGSSLATVFNERSVLENFHCLTIGRIIQERWPALFADTDGVLRRMVLEMILSTDMALHFDFMARFEALKTSIIQDPIDDKQRRLICCCIMKSADISNLVNPPFHTVF